MSNSVIKVRDFSGKLLTENDIQSVLDELLKQILDDSKLKTFRTDSGFLLRFLHCADFSIPMTIIKIRAYHELFLEYPDWFLVKSPLQLKENLEFQDKIILKEKDRKGRSIFIIKTGKIRTDKTYPAQEVQLVELWIEYFSDDFQTQCNGLSTILDMKDYSWKLFRWLTPTNIRVATRKVDTYPLKDIVIHVVNTSFLINASIKLVWPFLSERVRRMFKFHFDNWESLHEYIDPKHLPTEYGGTRSDLDFNTAVKWLITKNDEMAERFSKQKILIK